MRTELPGSGRNGNGVYGGMNPTATAAQSATESTSIARKTVDRFCWLRWGWLAAFLARSETATLRIGRRLVLRLDPLAVLQSPETRLGQPSTFRQQIARLVATVLRLEESGLFPRIPLTHAAQETLSIASQTDRESYRKEIERTLADLGFETTAESRQG